MNGTMGTLPASCCLFFSKDYLGLYNGYNMEMKYYKANRIRCTKCGDILEYIHKDKDSNPGYVLRCKCGVVALDPSACMYRILYQEDGDFEDLSEEWVE